MKLVSIVLHNHLSHRDTALELNGTRLAAIVGPNGAGKSALLEAIRYTLFDDARAKTDQLVRVGETDMSAAVEFDFGGARYRAVRGRSSKGAGRSYLELAVQAGDGTWTTLSGDDIRDTQRRIVELLGVDAGTFATAVFLGQGEANRFALATAGERKRILGQVLGLDVYARAEVRARDEARDLVATLDAEQIRLERLGDVVEELASSPAIAEARRQDIHELARAQTAAAAEREAITARLTDLAGELARGEDAVATVSRLEAERAELGTRYQRERAAAATATEAIATATRTLVDEDDVAAAEVAVPVARDKVAELEQAEAEDRRLAEEIRPRRQALDHAEREAAVAHSRWETALAAARDREASLVAAGVALQPVICEKCKHPNIVDQADIRGQLARAREMIPLIVDQEPKEPLSLSRERAAVARLEERRRELAWDPAPLANARALLSDVERRAARSEAMRAARSALEAAEASEASARQEMTRINAAGQRIAEQLVDARARTAGVAVLEAERDRLTGERASIDERIRRTQAERSDAERSLATIEANVARLEQATAEHDELAAAMAGRQQDLERLRRLVGAFGVTGIPARIIEGVLPELTGYANELLGELRPGMVLDIRAQREKRSGKGVVEALDLVVRDDVGDRPLAVFSGGERMSVSLAIATALSRLVARRAGARIESLVIDEPDGLDGEARRAFGQALRVIAHRGDLARVVLVSHHPDLAEYADDVWQVTKDGSGSTVELVSA